MIIDFHSHTFPDAIADKAISKLTASADIINYLNGTLADITRSGKEAGIDYSVLLPVVTNPKQYETINKTAVEVNHASDETGIISFGGLHPENANYKEIINYLSDNNIVLIKNKTLDFFHIARDAHLISDNLAHFLLNRKALLPLSIH